MIHQQFVDVDSDIIIKTVYAIPEFGNEMTFHQFGSTSVFTMGMQLMATFPSSTPMLCVLFT